MRSADSSAFCRSKASELNLTVMCSIFPGNLAG